MAGSVLFYWLFNHMVGPSFLLLHLISKPVIRLRRIGKLSMWSIAVGDLRHCLLLCCTLCANRNSLIAVSGSRENVLVSSYMVYGLLVQTAVVHRIHYCCLHANIQNHGNFAFVCNNYSSRGSFPPSAQATMLAADVPQSISALRWDMWVGVHPSDGIEDITRWEWCIHWTKLLAFRLGFASSFNQAADCVLEIPEKLMDRVVRALGAGFAKIL